MKKRFILAIIMIEMKQVYAALREKYSAGMTQQEIADATGVSQTYIGNLLSGQRPIDGLTLKKVNQLFPDAVIVLNGETTSTTGNSKLERKLLALFRELDEDDQLEALVYLSRLTANKSEEAATTPDQKIG